MAAGVELHVPAPFADIPVLEDMAIDSIVLCSTRLPINGGGGDVSAAGQGLNKRETWRQSTTSHSSSSLFPHSPRIPGLKPRDSVRQRDTSVVYRGCRQQGLRWPKWRRLRAARVGCSPRHAVHFLRFTVGVLVRRRVLAMPRLMLFVCHCIEKAPRRRSQPDFWVRCGI